MVKSYIVNVIDKLFTGACGFIVVGLSSGYLEIIRVVYPGMISDTFTNTIIHEACHLGQAVFSNHVVGEIGFGGKTQTSLRVDLIVNNPLCRRISNELL